jgi:hypothetical protein
MFQNRRHKRLSKFFARLDSFFATIHPMWLSGLSKHGIGHNNYSSFRAGGQMRANSACCVPDVIQEPSGSVKMKCNMSQFDGPAKANLLPTQQPDSSPMSRPIRTLEVRSDPNHPREAEKEGGMPIAHGSPLSLSLAASG